MTSCVDCLPSDYAPSCQRCGGFVSPHTRRSTLPWTCKRHSHPGRMIIMGEEVIASIHNVDLAPVLALAPSADSATPVPAPGHCAVAGNRALPHQSYARNLRIPRMGRVGRCLTFCPPLNMEDG